MIPQELRIGNLIKDVGETQDVYSVSEITLNSFTAGPMTVYRAGFEFDHGIHLTEEWLMKLGFIKEKEFPWCNPKEQLFEIEIYHDQIKHIWDATYTDATIEFVHQLQNLYFALTSQELEIK